MPDKMRFIFISSSDDVIGTIFSDLLSDDRVQIIDGHLKQQKNIILHAIQKVHLSLKINTVFNLPFRRVWTPLASNNVLDEDTTYYIIFTDEVPRYLEFSQLNRARKAHNIKYIMIYLNSWSSPFGKCYQYNLSHMKFDYIFSFDEVDARQHGFLFTFIPYSKQELPSMDDANETDLCYIGRKQNRLAELLEIYRDSKAANVRASFRITEVPAKEQQFSEEIRYNQPISYTAYLRELKGSNCILEVVRGGQSGASSRYYEAVCYNKKLLTNNSNIVNLPFYNPEYMKVIDRPENIDWEWVKQRVPINYHYDGRFSPIRLIDRIVDMENGGGKWETRIVIVFISYPIGALSLFIQLYPLLFIQVFAYSCITSLRMKAGER